MTDKTLARTFIFDVIGEKSMIRIAGPNYTGNPTPKLLTEAIEEFNILSEHYDTIVSAPLEKALDEMYHTLLQIKARLRAAPLN